MTTQHNYLKEHWQGTRHTFTFARNLGHVSNWDLATTCTSSHEELWTKLHHATRKRGFLQRIPALHVASEMSACFYPRAQLGKIRVLDGCLQRPLVGNISSSESRSKSDIERVLHSVNKTFSMSQHLIPEGSLRLFIPTSKLLRKGDKNGVEGLPRRKSKGSKRHS